jgi:putative component of membrane protein insertase Oxa1/YidC/SpoIIIJ protein YidD
MRALALLAIDAYQRHLSPYKGFTCAYRCVKGGPSCSTIGARLIRRYGVVDGLLLTRRQLQRCAQVAERRRGPNGRFRQRGDCDPGCAAGCDAPDPGQCLQGAECLNPGGCDGCGRRPDKHRRESRSGGPLFR